MPVRPVEWKTAGRKSLVPGRVSILDQTRLPGSVVRILTADVKVVHEAIRSLRVRGAPAIGVAAGMGVVLAAQAAKAKSGAAVAAAAVKAADYLASTRPTAVNLFYALDRMKRTARECTGMAPEMAVEVLAAEALSIFWEDAAMCRMIGDHGASLLRDGQTVLTHCNAGSLATAEYGTALAAVYSAKEHGKRIAVFSDETRPLLQGSRLTAWELMREGVDVTVICDNTAAQVMKEGRIGAVLVGADRIAANGDAANKIGTYGVAVLARAHRIPFYVLAPTTTFDLTLKSGREIPIEQRGADEVVCGFGKQTAPAGAKVYSPAFDVTPAGLISAIVCESGICRAPYGKSLKKAVKRAGELRLKLSKHEGR